MRKRTNTAFDRYMEDSKRHNHLLFAAYERMPSDLSWEEWKAEVEAAGGYPMGNGEYIFRELWSGKRSVPKWARERKQKYGTVGVYGRPDLTP